MEVWAAHSRSFPQNNFIQISYWQEIVCFLPFKGVFLPPVCIARPPSMGSFILHVYADTQICKSKTVNLQRQRARRQSTAWKELIKTATHTRTDLLARAGLRRFGSKSETVFPKHTSNSRLCAHVRARWRVLAQKVLSYTVRIKTEK